MLAPAEIPQKMTALAQEFEACRPAFIALGDENRQRILIILLENYGGLRVGEIARRVNLSRPAVSHHLKILKDARIINFFRDGTMNYYHMEANEGQWRQVGELMAHANEVVQAVAAMERAGEGCFSQDENCV